MGKNAGELPRKIVSSHSLENDCKKKEARSTESVEKIRNLCRASESATLIVAETEASPTKTLNVLHVAAVGEFVANNDVNIVAKGVSVARQECLISSSHGGSGAMERLSHDKLGSLSGEGLRRIVEADQSVTLALIKESCVHRYTGGLEAVLSYEVLLSGDVGRFLRSELQQITSCGTKRRVSSDIDVERLSGPPSKSVMFDIERGSNTLESSSRILFEISTVGQCVPITSQYGGTDCGTSELESIARKTTDEPVETNVCVGSAKRFSLHSIIETETSLVTGWTKY